MVQQSEVSSCQEVKNDWEVSVEGGISEPSSDILLNWRDMRSEFGYTMLGDIFRS